MTTSLSLSWIDLVLDKKISKLSNLSGIKCKLPASCFVLASRKRVKWRACQFTQGIDYRKNVSLQKISSKNFRNFRSLSSWHRQTYKLKSFKRNIFLFRLDFALQQGWGIRLSCSIQILVNATPGYTFDYHIQYLFNMFSIFSKHFTIKTRRKLLKIPFQISFSPFCFQFGRKFSGRNFSPVDWKFFFGYLRPITFIPILPQLQTLFWIIFLIFWLFVMIF